jgi:hypothetical protein
MAPMDPEPSRPALSSTGKSTGWKVPALAVAAVLVVIVVVARGGPTERTVPTAPPSPALLEVPGPPDLVEASTINGQLLGVFTRSRDGLTYADGIPTLIDGDPVERVQKALLAPLGRLLLVGGWYRNPSCHFNRGTVSCPSPTMSDVPLEAGMGDVRTTFVALNTRLGNIGAHVLLAELVNDPGCAIHADGGQCQPRLRVLKELWSGPG